MKYWGKTDNIDRDAMLEIDVVGKNKHTNQARMQSANWTVGTNLDFFVLLRNIMACGKEELGPGATSAAINLQATGAPGKERRKADVWR